MATMITATLPTTFAQNNEGSTLHAVDTITESTPGVGVTVNKLLKPTAGISATGNIAATGNLTGVNGVFSGTVSATGAQTPTGGIGPAGGFLIPTVYHSGGVPAITTTQGTDTTPVNTETYIVEVFVENNCTLTGVSILNGSAVAGNVTVGLFDSAGNALAAAKSASTAQSGTAAYQKIPFAVAYVAVGPAKFFIGVQFDTNTTPRFRTHILGNFGASKKTAEVYGTFTNVTPPTTFTTAQGVIADTY